MYCKKCGTENDDNALECRNCKMQFAKKTQKKFILTILIISVITVVILLIPYGISKYTDSILEQKKITLKDIGINFKIESSSGYLSSKRKVSFEVDNGRYLANYIYKSIKNKIPESKATLDTLFYDKGIDWEAILTGLKLKGVLVTDNLLIKKPKLTLSLKELSNEIMDEIKSDRKASKVILPFLDNDTLGCNITFDLLDEKIISFRLKDIDESIHEKKTRIKFQFFNPIYENKSQTEDKYSFSRLYASVKDRNDLVNIQIDNLDFLQNKYNDIDFNTNLNIKNILFLVNERKNFKFTTENISIQDKIQPTNNEINIEHKISVDDVNILVNNKKISLQNLLFKFTINNLDKQSLTSIINDYNENDFNPDDINIENIFDLINYGANIQFDINTKKFIIDSNRLGNNQFSANIKLSKNNFSKEDKNLDNLINNLNVFAELKIDKKTAKFLTNLDKAFKTYFELSIKDGDYKIFQLSIKNAKITINGIDISLWAEVVGDVYFDKENYYGAIDLYKYSAEHGNNSANFRLAYSYDEIGKYKKAVKTYKKYIKNEKDKKAAAVAMNNLSYVYKNHLKNWKESIKWAKKAIKNGYDYQYFGIAYCYDMLKDYKNAEKWYKKSIKQNEPIAMWNLGIIYKYGKGKIKKDEKRAWQLYLKAARLGYQPAIKLVSKAYKYGWYGVSIDLSKANYWNKKIKE